MKWTLSVLTVTSVVRNLWAYFSKRISKLQNVLPYLSCQWMTWDSNQRHQLLLICCKWFVILLKKLPQIFSDKFYCFNGAVHGHWYQWVFFCNSLPWPGAGLWGTALGPEQAGRAAEGWAGAVRAGCDPIALTVSLPWDKRKSYNLATSVSSPR